MAPSKGLEAVLAAEAGILAGKLGELVGLADETVDVAADVDLAGVAAEALAVGVVDFVGDAVALVEVLPAVSLVDECDFVSLVVEVVGPAGDATAFGGREAAPPVTAFAFVGSTGFVTSTSFLSFLCFWTFSLS